jgi:hypothetical protein
MINDKLQKKLEELKDMGINEAMDFKQVVINSLLDNPTKFYVFDRIDERLKAIGTDADVFVAFDEEIDSDR